MWGAGVAKQRTFRPLARNPKFLARNQKRKVLAGIASAEDAPPAARVAAVTALFDRGWGKALQPHVGHDGNEIRVTIRQIFESVDKEEPLLLEHETPEK